MRNHHRDEGDDSEEELEGDVGPGVQVGQKKGQDGGDDGGADGEDDRIDEDLGERGIGIGLDVLRESEAAEGAEPLAEASQDEHDDGADREKSDNRDQARREGRSCLLHRTLPVLIQENGAVTRVEVQRYLFAFPDGGRRLDPEDQEGLSDPDLPLVGVSDEDQRFDLSPEDVASLLVVAFEHPDEFGTDAHRDGSSRRGRDLLQAGDGTDRGIDHGKGLVDRGRPCPR